MLQSLFAVAAMHAPHRPQARGLFQRALEHACRFRESLDERPPWPALDPEAMARRFAEPTPERGEDGRAVIDALVRAAEPGLSASAGPRFFGWVIGASHPVGVAADVLTSAWGQNAGNHVAAPAAAAAEAAAAAWLLDILRLPPESSIGFVTGATMASFVGLAAARNAVLRRAGWDVEAHGLCGAPPIRVLVGRDAHVTILSALRYLGLGSQPIWIDTDDQGRMNPAHLRKALAADRLPAVVVAQAGQINTGGFDPFLEIAAATRTRGAWLHIDGAFGLWARAVPELDHLTTGVELADSWSVDGHKWLQLPYDSGFAIVRDVEAHRRAMSVSASYLPAAEDEVRDPGQLVPELSRRARGFAAWAMIRHLGRRGIAELVRGHCALAQRLADHLAGQADVQVLNRIDLNQVLLSFGDGPAEARDRATREVIARLQRDNVCLAGGADWHGRAVLRVSIISAPLAEPDIDRLAAEILAAWRAVRAEQAAVQPPSPAEIEP